MSNKKTGIMRAALRDESGDTGLFIPAGAEVGIESDEGDYWVCAYLGASFPVDKDMLDVD